MVDALVVMDLPSAPLMTAVGIVVHVIWKQQVPREEVHPELLEEDPAP